MVGCFKKETAPQRAWVVLMKMVYMKVVLKSLHVGCFHKDLWKVAVKHPVVFAPKTIGTR